MKATMTTGDQILPAKLGLKENTGRKEGGSRAHAARFEEVLSNLAEAANRNRQPKANSHRTTEPIAPSADAQPRESRHDLEAILSDVAVAASTLSTPAANPPAVAVPPLLSVTSRDALPPLARHANSRAPTLSSPKAPVVAASHVVGNARDQIDVSPGSPEPPKKPAVIGERRAAADVRSQVGGSPASAGRAKEPIVTDVLRSAPEPGIPMDALPPAAVQERASIGKSHAVSNPASRSDVPLSTAAKSIERSLFGAQRVELDAGAQPDISPEVPATFPAALDAGAQPDISPEAPVTFPAASNIEVRRAPDLVARPAVQAMRSGAAPDRPSLATPGENLSIIAKEKHFQPAAPPREPGAQPMTSVAGAPSSRPDRADIMHAAQTPAEEPAAAPASRSDTQLKPTPLATPSPLQQVAAAIGQEIGSVGSEPLDIVVGAPLPARQPQGQEPLRILKVALDPPELGRVTIRLRLTGGALDVTVTAERAETASLLDRDRHLLSKVLTASGYSTEDVKVQTPAPSLPTAAPTSRGAATQAGNQATPQFQSNGSAEGERQPPRPQDGGRGQSPQETHGEEADSDPRGGNDLYV